MITVSVPASTANLGAGFDCLALALDLRNTVEFEDLGDGQGVELAIEGEGAEKLARDSSSLLVRAAEAVFQRSGRRLGGRLRLRSTNGIPLGSGMGSSAAAIVAGLLGANALVNAGLGQEDLLRMAFEIEGHPDNAAAALHGGLVIVSAEADALQVRRLPLAPLRVVIALPELRLSTATARRALPVQVPLADAVFNLGHAMFTVQALGAGDEALLAWAVADRLHQRYREKLIPGYAAVEHAARQAGASAVALSGAGPSLIAFASSNHARIAQAMEAAFAAAGLKSRTFILGADTRGAIVEASA